MVASVKLTQTKRVVLETLANDGHARVMKYSYGHARLSKREGVVDRVNIQTFASLYGNGLIRRLDGLRRPALFVITDKGCEVLKRRRRRSRTSTP